MFNMHLDSDNVLVPIFHYILVLEENRLENRITDKMLL